jgi:glycosyltransferase involved in cell wall biosynthesis
MRVLVIPHAYSAHLAIREIELARCWAARHEVYVTRPPVPDGACGLRQKLRFHASALRMRSERSERGWQWVTMPACYRLPILQGRLTALAIQSLLTRFQFDVVINASYFGNAAPPGLMGAEMPPGRYRYLYDLVDDHVGGHQLYGRGREAACADRIIRQEIGKADEVIAITPYVRDVCRARYGRDAVVVPNGFHAAPLRAETGEDACALREKLGLQAGPVIGYIGSLDGWVDIEFAIQVFRCLQTRHPDLQLLIVGGGERLAALRRRHVDAPNLTLAGWVPREAIGPYFQLVDVGLIPFAENALTHAALPIKALEYGAWGKPVVASRLRGLLDLHLSYVACLPMQLDTWCERIEQLLAEAGAPPVPGELEAYRWEVLAKQVERLFG